MSKNQRTDKWYIRIWKRAKAKFDWRAAVVFAVAIVMFILAYHFANLPVAKYNSDPQDAESLMFTHVDLAIDYNRILFSGEKIDQTSPDDGSSVEVLEYETAIVTRIVDESWQRDPYVENVHVGSQLLEVKILSGRYKGQTYQVINQMSKSFDKYSKVGTKLLVYVKTDYSEVDDNGIITPTLTIMNYDRSMILYVLVAVFLLVTILVGGRVGLRSILALGFTLACVIMILVPLILHGYNPIWLTIAICIYVTIVSFVLLDGISRKTMSAILGTAMGFIIAALFAKLAGSFARIDGLEYNVSETDTLIQAQYQGTPIQIRGLFVSGIVIAALGAVMDVAMSISSSINELKRVNSTMGWKQLFKSGMNIGRDAVGTMTNTLILAFTGGALVEMILILVNNWDYRAIINSDFMTGEIITGIAGSIGLILAVPVTALVGSLLIGSGRTPSLSKTK